MALSVLFQLITNSARVAYFKLWAFATFVNFWNAVSTRTYIDLACLIAGQAEPLVARMAEIVRKLALAVDAGANVLSFNRGYLIVGFLHRLKNCTSRNIPANAFSVHQDKSRVARLARFLTMLRAVSPDIRSTIFTSANLLQTTSPY